MPMTTKGLSYILKQQCLFVCVGSAWKILPVIARSLWCLSVYGDKQGRAGQGRAARAGQPGQPLRGAGRGAISIKKILGENRGTCI